MDLTLTAEPPRTSRVASETRRIWMRGPAWDLGWLIGSSVVVPLGLVAVWAGLSADVINLGVTLLVGGPHLFSTFLATYLDPRFRRSHRGVLIGAAVLVPTFVVFMTLWDFQILLSLFIFAASAHVLQQNAYIAGVYRRRAGHPEPAWSVWLDWAVLGLSFYPFAAFKLVRGEFLLGDVEILIPSFSKVPFTAWAITIAFAAAAAGWIGKTALEARRGVLNVPKTVLIAFTATIALLVPLTAAGTRLELAFQAVNLWHSIQYLGLAWLILHLRKEAGQSDSAFLRAISGRGRRAWGFYGILIGASVLLFGTILGLAAWNPFGLQFNQYYYMGILSGLLVHYVLDAYLFAVANREDASPEIMPYALPSRG
jgi:hypothetical protein